jgi:EF hand domain-containing protein
MKRFALLLVVVAACKTTDSSPQPAPSEPATPTVRQPAPPATRPAPTLPAEGSSAADTPEGPGRWDRRNNRLARMDTDGDGKISDAERAAAMKQRAEMMRTRLDTNGDGKLTPDELAAAQGRMHFDDPASLDTNKDGDISADELAAAMQARRDAMRAKRDAAAAGSAAGQ